jgi:hypothetical protein
MIDNDNDNDNEDDDESGDSVVMILDVALTRPMTKDVRDFWMAADNGKTVLVYCDFIYHLFPDYVHRCRLGVKFAAMSKAWIPRSYKSFVNSLAPNFSGGAFKSLE